jgi:hypothetical protein
MMQLVTIHVPPLPFTPQTGWHRHTERFETPEGHQVDLSYEHDDADPLAIHVFIDAADMAVGTYNARMVADALYLHAWDTHGQPAAKLRGE